MVFSLLEGVCWQGGGAIPRNWLQRQDWNRSLPVLRLSFPFHQAAPGEAILDLMPLRGKQVRRFAANSDPNPQLLRDLQSSSPLKQPSGNNSMQEM